MMNYLLQFFIINFFKHRETERILQQLLVCLLCGSCSAQLTVWTPCPRVFGVHFRAICRLWNGSLKHGGGASVA